MADEARDGHVEQLAVCVRYVTANGTVKEHFIELSDITSFNAKSITDAIEHVLTLRAVPEADDLFETLGNVYSFFSVSVLNHQAFCDTQAQLGLENRELVQLCKTRWGCQLNSVKAVLENLTALLGCLEKVATPIAVGLLSKVSWFSSVYMLVMFKSLLSATEGLHKYLQKESVDLAQATLYKDAVLKTLTLMRSNEETAEQLYKETKIICESNNISETLSGPRRKQRADG
ncbi:hypothetical protein QQF64_006258 [Cirrhinus molitorella]|uniref:Uncharacterized protein n=1 Tax=Cirrhinus molitorella TaxID=172907 RepID=A0ABR3MHN1_9TELE